MPKVQSKTHLSSQIKLEYGGFNSGKNKTKNLHKIKSFVFKEKHCSRLATAERSGAFATYSCLPPVYTYTSFCQVTWLAQVPPSQPWNHLFPDHVQNSAHLHISLCLLCLPSVQGCTSAGLWACPFTTNMGVLLNNCEVVGLTYTTHVHLFFTTLAPHLCPSTYHHYLNCYYCLPSITEVKARPMCVFPRLLCKILGHSVY